MTQLRSFLTVAVVGLFLAACGGSDSPTAPGNNGGGGGAGGGGSERTIKDDPSFSNDVMEIFTRKGCAASQCHGSGEGGLTMGDANTTHGNLVNVTSPTSGQIRVIPGNADESYLIVKVSPNPPFGDQMPLNGTPLDDIDLTNLRNWINQGAQNN